MDERERMAKAASLLTPCFGKAVVRKENSFRSMEQVLLRHAAKLDQKTSTREIDLPVETSGNGSSVTPKRAREKFSKLFVYRPHAGMAPPPPFLREARNPESALFCVKRLRVLRAVPSRLHLVACVGGTRRSDTGVPT